MINTNQPRAPEHVVLQNNVFGTNNSKLPAAVTSPDQYSKVAKRDVTAVRSLK